MGKKISRKKFIELTTKGAIGGAVAFSIFNLANGAKAQTPITWPLPYTPLDLEHVRKLGHQFYWTGKGCCFGAFKAIVYALHEKLGEPFTTLLPLCEMMIYGHGGVVGWGTTCGALLGAAPAVNLFCDKATTDKIVHELMGWYTEAIFPSDISNQYGQNGQFYDNRLNKALPQSKCGSPLCHVSVTKWCIASGYKASSMERKERCARLTGDVVAQTVKLLNDWYNNQLQPTYQLPGVVTGCLTCHGSAGKENVRAIMTCDQCHKPNWAHPQVTKVEQLSEIALNFKLSQAYPNPFNPTTNIEFSLPKSCDVRLEIYDTSGRIVRRLIDGERYKPGTYKVVWDGTDDHGNRVASRVYLYRMIAGEFVATKKMVLAK